MKVAEEGRALTRLAELWEQYDALILGEIDGSIEDTRRVIESEARNSVLDARVWDRYRLYGGSMVPDPDGQWFHVQGAGIKSWVLDPLMPQRREDQSGG